MISHVAKKTKYKKVNLSVYLNLSFFQVLILMLLILRYEYKFIIINIKKFK